MSREHPAYRDNLEDLLTFFDGKRVLSIKEVARYTGKDARWVKSHLGFQDQNCISVPTLARRLCEGV
ncbi:MAG: hypothetical protein Q3X66_07760 [Evtepia sp.]|nr:hypothetical protein [Evtepia sp.]